MDVRILDYLFIMVLNLRYIVGFKIFYWVLGFISFNDFFRYYKFGE